MVKVAVLGNINMDVILRTDEFPMIGETKLINDIKYLPGGKGANQAVAARRLGAEVFLVGRVGDDAFGEIALTNFKRQGVDISFIKKNKRLSTGTAFVISRKDGANSILSYPGANQKVTKEDVDSAKDRIGKSDILLVQIGVPLSIVDYAISVAYELGINVFLDPTPLGRGFPTELEKVSVLSPNEVELKMITGSDDMNKSFKILHEKNIPTIVLKAGQDGCYVYSNGETSHIPGFTNIEAVDTTGAGDTFSAAFAVRIASGDKLKDAALFANAAGALATTRLGAQEGMPTYDMVTEFLKKGNLN